MHDIFCSDGDNMCGGPFEHERSEQDIVAAAINKVTENEPVKPFHNSGDSDADAISMDDTSNHPQVDSAMSEVSTEILVIDVDAGDGTASEKSSSNIRSSRLKEDEPHMTSAMNLRSSKKKIEVIDVDAEV
jgi:hypothetical protein